MKTLQDLLIQSSGLSRNATFWLETGEDEFTPLSCEIKSKNGSPEIVFSEVHPEPPVAEPEDKSIPAVKPGPAVKKATPTAKG